MARLRCRAQGTRRATLAVRSVACGAPYGARNARHWSRRACHGRRPGCFAVSGARRTTHDARR
eukprot:10732488-Alexandrium_andersonii.AAC.1